MTNRHLLLCTTAFTAVLSVAAPAALAADAYGPDVAAVAPAVSAVNGKLGAFGGGVDEDGVFGAFGALSLPLGQRFGAQFDGMVGQGDDATFYGGAAHLFWRDPSKGLIGGFASYVNWDASSTLSASYPEGAVADYSGAAVGKVGIEAEAYLGRFTLEGSAAYQFGTDDGFAGKATVAFYPVDDLRLDLSLRHLEGLGTTGGAGLEWSPGGSPFAIFADASINEHSDWAALGGVTVYFGEKQKSLIRRHREDDPSVELPNDLYRALGNSYCPPGTEEDGDYCDGIN